MKNSIYIIGGGTSLENFDFDKLKNKDVIAVNKSINYCSGAKYFITMDYTLLRKMKLEHNVMLATKIFIANFTFDFMKEQNGQIVDTRFNLIYDLKDFDVIIKSRRKNEFGLTFNQFANGQNSAFCALQLAIILEYKTINLLGFDLKCENKTHFHEGYNQDIEKFKIKLDEYYNYFYDSIKKLLESTDINIYSCSKISRLNNILEYKEF